MKKWLKKEKKRKKKFPIREPLSTGEFSRGCLLI